MAFALGTSSEEYPAVPISGCIRSLAKPRLGQGGGSQCTRVGGNRGFVGAGAVHTSLDASFVIVWCSFAILTLQWLGILFSKQCFIEITRQGPRLNLKKPLPSASGSRILTKK